MILTLCKILETTKATFVRHFTLRVGCKKGQCLEAIRFNSCTCERLPLEQQVFMKILAAVFTAARAQINGSSNVQFFQAKSLKPQSVSTAMFCLAKERLTNCCLLHSTAMFCFVQKCHWLCCNFGWHVFRNRQRKI